MINAFHMIGPSHRSITVNFDDSLGKGLRGFLRHIVANAFEDSVRIFAGEFMGIGCAIRGRAIEITGGALSQAEAGYRQLIELYPTASAFHYRYALVLRALGNPQAAYDEMM